ncbi:hypothetical protein EV121DRAFT_204574 [Schizophyllum commune]
MTDQPTGPIETTLCDYETVESVTEQLYSDLHELVSKPFFKYFRADLYRECPFWPDDGQCNEAGCGITSLDESDVPEKFRAKALSQVSSVSEVHKLPGCYYRDTDFCYLDDDTGTQAQPTTGEYYDLSTIPERYTGYAGQDARRIWRAIYEENCFGLSELNLMKTKNPAPVTLPDTMTDPFKNENDEVDASEQCLEKKVYYKIISGLHASISTHICYESLDKETGEWGPNLPCFVARIASHPERLQYIYFNTVLMLRAVARLGPYLEAYDYCAFGKHEDDEETLSKLHNVIDTAQTVGKFDETVLFRGENANVLKEEFKSHFRNVTRIMDCTGCDKCRLWGKVQTMGLATAMKILFELDETALDPNANAGLLTRQEVVALINTLHRFAESLHATNVFREMWQQTNEDESEKLITEAERAAKVGVVGISDPRAPLTLRQPRTSPAVGSEARLWEQAQLRFADIFRICRDGTMGCIGFIAGMWREVVQTMQSVFAPGAKSQGPGYSTEL